MKSKLGPNVSLQLCRRNQTDHYWGLIARVPLGAAAVANPPWSPRLWGEMGFGQQLCILAPSGTGRCPPVLVVCPQLMKGYNEWHWTSLAWWLTEPVGTVLISSFGFLLRLLSRANSLALLVCWDADCLPWPSPAVYHAVIQHSVWVGPLSTACSGLIIITLPCCRTAERTALHWGTGLLVHGNVLGRHCSPTRETGHDLHKCILDSHGEELPS